MAHEIESAVYARVPAWHGLGVVIEEAPNSEEALRIAALDWEVKQTPALVEIDGKRQTTPFIFNYRSSDNTVLGVVKDQYKIVQNKEAFAFTDALLDSGEVKYESAGSLGEGKRVWMLARLPETSILGETHIPYLLFNNSHDGSSAVRVTITNTRVVCQNTLNVALAKAPRIWSCSHSGNIADKLLDARDTLRNAMAYMGAFKDEAERLATKKFSAVEVKAILDCLFPVDESEVGKRRLNNMIYLRQNFEAALKRPDIEAFRNTAYGIVNAASDFILHAEPLRKSANYKEAKLASFMDGNSFLDNAYKLVV